VDAKGELVELASIDGTDDKVVTTVVELSGVAVVEVVEGGAEVTVVVVGASVVVGADVGAGAVEVVVLGGAGVGAGTGSAVVGASVPITTVPEAPSVWLAE
jgi:hypothetical protein